MATKPSTLPVFDSNGTNTTPTTAGHQTDGFANNEIPTAGEINWMFWRIYLWINYLYSNIGTCVQGGFGPVLRATNFSQTFGGSPLGYSATGATSSIITSDLRVPQGYKLTSMSLNVTGSVGAGTLVLVLVKGPYASSYADYHTYTITSVPTASTSVAINFAASGSVSAQSITVAAAGGTFTRSGGSFITDGFFVGQTIQWKGFTNSGNNALKVITALSATVMTVSTTGLVNESAAVGAVSVDGSCPTVDDTFQWYFEARTTPGAGLTTLLCPPRCTMVPQ